MIPREPTKPQTDVEAVGIELARVLATSPRVGRGARWGVQAEMLLAESAGERDVLNDLVLAHRLLVQLRALAEQGEATR